MICDKKLVTKSREVGRGTGGDGILHKVQEGALGGGGLRYTDLKPATRHSVTGVV